jgi:hypothetical protein
MYLLTTYTHHSELHLITASSAISTLYETSLTEDYCLMGCTFRPCRWRQYITPKRRWACARLSDVTFQMIIWFLPLFSSSLHLSSISLALVSAIHILPLPFSASDSDFQFYWFANDLWMLAAVRPVSPVGRVFPARCDPHNFPLTPVYICWPYLLPPTVLIKLKGRCLNSKRNTASNETANKLGSVGFDCLTEVVMKSIVFWDIMPCSPSKVNRSFGGTFRLHLQNPMSRTRYQRESR